MLFWVVYDISDNRLRNKISDKCKDYGLKRVQKSVFFGEATRNIVGNLEVELNEILESGNETDSILILPVCNSCFEKKRAIGKKIDFEGLRDDFIRFFG